MKISRLFLTMLAGSAMFVSCNSDDGSLAPLGAYDNGILVVNEGNFSAGTITFIGDDMTTVQQNVYGAQNPGDGLGGNLQSVFFDGDKAFIISGSNKITVVNRYTFELIDKIETGLMAPRYGVVVNGKAFVTNQATFGSYTDDYIAVIDLSTYEVETTIALNAVAERIIEENGKIYVTNGTFGNGHSVSVINPGTYAITKTIDTGISPSSFEEENGILYVLCSNFADPSKLVRIKLSTNEILSEVTFPGSLGNAQNLNIEDGKLYFTVDSKIFSADLNATTISDTPLFTSEAAVLYGFAVEGNRIFVGDAKDFASDGKVFIYSKTGTLQNQFAVGLIPNGFYFND